MTFITNSPDEHRATPQNSETIGVTSPTVVWRSAAFRGMGDLTLVGCGEGKHSFSRE